VAIGFILCFEERERLVGIPLCGGDKSKKAA
jgi:hypothetical protein